MPKKSTKKEWPMLGGSVTWLDPRTADNLIRIYKFLKAKTNLKKRNRPEYSYNQLHKALGISPPAVQRACSKGAFMTSPLFRIRAIKFPNPDKRIGGVICSEVVKLVRLID